MNFVFFGTRELGAKVLEQLLENGYIPSLVVTGPDRPAGRKQKITSSPVKEVALKYNLPLAQPENPTELLERKELREAELFVLGAYGNILPKELVELPPKGVLNVHPSLLPKYRGPSPERFVLLNGDEKTGVTVMLMDEEVDHGPVLAQEEFDIPEGIRHEELHLKLGEIGGELLVRTIPQWLEGKIVPTEQDHSKVTFTKKVTKEDGRIDWAKEAEYIARQIRAFHPWPGTYTTFNAKSLKILKASSIKLSLGDKRRAPGTIFLAANGALAVAAGKGVLIIDELQFQGRKPMPAKDFLLGHRDFIGTILK